jgi:hypothetical protein
MDNKQNLLITMGCSYTEGVGCWDLNTVPSGMNKSNTWHEKYLKIYSKNINNFHEKGWPNKLGMMLGYNKVINLGLAGSSTSGQVKVFVEKYLDKDLSNYNVTVVWLLTEPSRFSFYKEGGVCNILPSENNNPDNQIGSAYLNFIKDINLDPMLEQIFYVKLFTMMCENKGYNFVFSYWEHHSGNQLVSHYKNPHFLYNEEHHLLPNWPYKDPIASHVCLHPNENGYELLATNFYKGIEKNHPHLIPEVKSKNFEWEWDGEITHFEGFKKM